MKTKRSAIGKPAGFLGALLRVYTEPKMKAVVSLAKNVILSLGLTVAASAVYAIIQKRIL